jgi:methionyl-tRNA formyltransferase
VYLKRPLSLAGTAEEILQRASALTQKMIVDIVKQRPVPLPQKGDVVEFKRRRPEHGDIATLGEFRQIYDYIRMLDAQGYSPAFFKTEHFHFEFSDAQLGDEFIEAKVRIRRPSND